jgi:hypothetical protein
LPDGRQVDKLTSNGSQSFNQQACLAGLAPPKRLREGDAGRSANQPMLAYCGLLCDTCPIHLATLESDKSKQAALRIDIAAICNEKYGMTLGPSDVTDCDGCRADTGRIFSECLACEIRHCVRQKYLESCAACGDYPCKILERVFHDDPAAQDRLDAIRNNR